jgi:iron complex transport system permease protein
MKYSAQKTILLLLAILFLVVFLGIITGAVNLSLWELLAQENRPILYLRLLRILLSILVGAGLAISGIVLQAILRNPLAEPYLLGTSSGAGLGAVISLIMGLGSFYLPAAAFIGAILSIFLVYTIARQGNKIPVTSLILSGVIVSIAFSGVIVLLVSFSANEALHGLMWWLWGSLEVYDFHLLLVISLVVFLGIATIFIFSQDLNAISLGEEEAIHLGIKTETVKKILFFLTSLITASLVSVCGIIGFVGLIIPHVMRMIVGANHKILIPASCLGAAIFMIICDAISRTVFSPLEIPIGVITAIIGAPVFIILLKRKQTVK